MSVAYLNHKLLRIIGRGFMLVIILMLPACSSSYQGIGANLDSSLSLGYQGSDTQRVQSEVRSGLSDHVETALTPEKKINLAKTSSPNLVATSKPTEPKLDPLAARDLINSYRIAKGLKPLMIHPQLTQAAENHTKDLASQDKISHYGTDGSTPWDRVIRTGFTPRVAAENVGTGQMSIKEVLNGWKNSPSHDENLLLSDATHLGIAMVHKPNSKMQTFWALVVGSPL